MWRLTENQVQIGLIQLASLDQNQASLLRVVLDNPEKTERSNSFCREQIIKAIQITLPKLRHNEKQNILGQKI